MFIFIKIEWACKVKQSEIVLICNIAVFGMRDYRFHLRKFYPSFIPILIRIRNKERWFTFIFHNLSIRVCFWIFQKSCTNLFRNFNEMKFNLPFCKSFCKSTSYPYSQLNLNILRSPLPERKYTRNFEFSVKFSKFSQVSG